MKKWTNLIFCIIVCPCFLFARSGILTGKITDSRTGESLPGVTILLDDSTGTVSDANGIYSMNASAGKHSVQLRLVGYISKMFKFDLAENEKREANIRMEAASEQLGTIVITASRFEQKIEETTVSMEVMRPSLLENTNATSMESAMDQVPGVTMTDGNASIRGGSGFSYGAGSRVLVLVDDLPMLAADAGDVKWSFLPMENLEQVEVIKGASSALFGSSALNGVINLRTAWPKSTPETNIRIYNGMYDNPKNKQLRWWRNANPVYEGTNFSHSRKAGPLDVCLGGNLFSDEGYREGEKEQRVRVNGALRYRFKKIDGLTASLKGGTYYTRGGNFLLWQNDSSGAYRPFGGLDTPATTLSNYITTRTNIDPAVTYTGKNGASHSVKGRFFRSNNRNDSNQEALADLYYGEYTFNKKFARDFRVTAGTGGMMNVVKSGLYGDHKGANYFLYGQAEKKFFRKLIVTFGIRGENSKVDTASTKENIYLLPQFFKDSILLKANSSLKPVMRLGANYQLLKGTFLRTSFGEGYRFPTIAEKFIRTNAGALYIFPNDSVRPETGWSAEVGARQLFKIGSFLGAVDLAAFQTEYHDMMEFAFGVWDTTPGAASGGIGFKSRNVNNIVIRGIDGSVSGEGMIAGIKFTLIGGYTYIDPRQKNFVLATDTITGSANYNVLKYRYRNTAKADLELEYKRFSGGLSFRYNSKMENIDRIFELIVPGVKHYFEQRPPNDYVFDGRIAFRPAEMLKISFIAKNILNREYMGRPADMQPPRSFALQADMKF